MVTRYVFVLLVALAGFQGVSELGLAHERVLLGSVSGELFSAAGESGSPTITSRSSAAGIGAINRVTKLAQKVARTGTVLDIPAAIREIAEAGARVSVHDEVARRAATLPDELWRPRLIHGLDPDLPWRDLKIAAIDLEGQTGNPTQIGVVWVSKRELSHELTLRITPNGGQNTPKAVEIRLLDGSKDMSEAGTFADSQELFETFVRDRVPLAFSQQGDLQGLMKEWSKIENPGSEHLYAVEPGVEWIDVEDWARMLAYGDSNNLKSVHQRVTGDILNGAHVGVNDARAAVRTLFTLAEENPGMPKTYGELIKHQLTWREYRGDFERMLKRRLDIAIAYDVEDLTSLYHREYQMALAELPTWRRTWNRARNAGVNLGKDFAHKLRLGAQAPAD